MEVLDQHTIDAYVAMVLVSLPLPPLPVVVVRGEDQQEGTCSSHDLHAVMLRTQMHMAHSNAFTDKQLLTHMDTKTRVIEELFGKLKSTLHELPERDDRMVHKCYGHLCAAFREYASAYAHTCRDLRILPLGDVVRGDPVHLQTCAYVSAVMESTAPYPTETSNRELSYAGLLCRWLLHLEANLE